MNVHSSLWIGWTFKRFQFELQTDDWWCKLNIIIWTGGEICFQIAPFLYFSHHKLMPQNDITQQQRAIRWKSFFFFLYFPFFHKIQLTRNLWSSEIVWLLFVVLNKRLSGYHEHEEINTFYIWVFFLDNDNSSLHASHAPETKEISFLRCYL